MTASVGDLYIHKDIGDTYLVTSTDSDGVGCINLDKGRSAWIGKHLWKVFYRPLTHTQEET